MMRLTALPRTGAGAVLGAALLTAPGLAAADANCVPTTVRVASATAADFTLIVTPAGGGAAVPMIGGLDSYQSSQGYGDTPPENVTEWDDTVERLAAPTDPDDPGWYGRAKGRAFAPVQFNQLATRFPADTLVVAYGPNPENPDACRMTWIRPVAP